MIGRSIGVLSDAQGGHLSADLINPLFAFSFKQEATLSVRWRIF